MEIQKRISKQMHDLMNQMGVMLLQIDMGAGDDPLALQKSSRLLYEDLLDLQMLLRMHLGTLKLNRMDTPLCDALEDALGRHEILADAMGVEVVMNCDYSLVAHYDRGLVVNVLSNALLRGINTGATQIALTAKPSNGGYLFVVEDNGSGEEPADQIQEGAERLDELIGQEVAKIHQRGEQEGTLMLGRSDSYGGSRVSLWIP